jgi:hypothetical protein
MPMDERTELLGMIDRCLGAIEFANNELSRQNGLFLLQELMEKLAEVDPSLLEADKHAA